MLSCSCIVFFIWLVSVCSANLAEWSVISSLSLPTLPRSDYGAAVCVVNESTQTLHILGGQKNRKQWVEYQLEHNTLIDHGDNALPTTIADLESSVPIREHSANYWTQTNGVLYYVWSAEDWNVPQSERKYTIHNLNVNEIGQPGSMQYWQTIPYATQTHDHCIAAHAGKLFVVGGMRPGFIYDGVANLAIYDFTTRQWVTGPSMQQPRQEPSCVVNSVAHELYVSGGFDAQDALDSVERIALTNIASQAWEDIAGRLAVGVYGHVMVYHELDNSILVIGGWDQSIARNEIQQIDCTTHAVAVIGALEYAVARPAFTYISRLHRIYLFGGKVANEEGTQRIQIIGAQVPTHKPTTVPTSNPLASRSPTGAPSKPPTSDPSSHPTIPTSPTPTLAPTVIPTASTSSPTFQPSTPQLTLSLTNQPTFTPTRLLLLTATNDREVTLGAIVETAATDDDIDVSANDLDDDNDDDGETLTDLSSFLLNNIVLIGCILAVCVSSAFVACVVICCWCRRTRLNKDAAKASVAHSKATQPPTGFGENTAVKSDQKAIANQTFLGLGMSDAALIEDDESVLDGIQFPTPGGSN